jgi:methylmalonyl-CoA mutase
MADRELPDNLNLSELFPSPLFEVWQREAERLLGDATDAASRAAVETPGFEWQPIFRADDLKDIPLDSPRTALDTSRTGWTILQECPYPDPERFNQELRFGLDHGLSGLYLKFDRSGRLGLDPEMARVGDIGWGGLSIATLDDLSKALNNVPLEQYPLWLDCGPSPLVGLGLLDAAAKRNNVSFEKLSGGLLVDPLGSLSTEGMLSSSLEQIFDELAAGIKQTQGNSRLTIANISAVIYQEAGLTAPDQLGCLLATGIAYLKEMESRAISPERFQSSLSFTLGVGSNLFVEIAKLRAARLLWARLMELAEISQSTPFPQLHVASIRTNRSLHDRHVNLLRGTAEAFAAILGGASSLMIAPIDQAHGLPDQFSLRMARNTQLILAEESCLGRVIDPAGGSYYVEKLTHALAEQAWNRLNEIETMGGMAHALQTGLIHQWVTEAVAHRTERLTRRKDVLVGTSRYINLDENPPEIESPHLEQLHDQRAVQIKSHKKNRKLPSSALTQLADSWSTNRDRIKDEIATLADKGATIGELSTALRGALSPALRIGPLTEFRPSEMFEYLREIVKRYEFKHNGQPEIRLVVIGDPAQLSPRIEFVRDYFAVAGYRTSYDKVYASSEEAVRELTPSPPALVVLIGPNKQYLDLVPEFCSALKEEAPKIPIVLAGYPQEDIDRFRKIGIAEFIYDGGDIHSSLIKLSHLIGVLP